MAEAMEPMVKVTKRALKTIIKQITFTDDALYIIMTKVESNVNSRPLANVSDNIDDYEALTLNHFLLGQRSNNTPVLNNKEVDMTLQHKWKAVQAASNIFWSRWTREYLPMLTERKKWSSLNVNLKKDDLILLCDKNLKRSYWSLGRIIETLSRLDNVVGAVKVATKNSSYVQLVASLELLEC